MKKKEICLIVVVALIALLSYLFLQNKTGDIILVKNSQGEVVLRTSLKTNANYTLTGKNGLFHLEVKDGSYRAYDVDCPDKICEKTGWVSKDNYKLIVCIPNGLYVELENE